MSTVLKHHQQEDRQLETIPDLATVKTTESGLEKRKH